MFGMEKMPKMFNVQTRWLEDLQILLKENLKINTDLIYSQQNTANFHPHQSPWHIY